MTVLRKNVAVSAACAPDPNSTPFAIMEETYRISQERGESIAFSDGVEAGMIAAAIFLAIGICIFEACKYFV
ncbi:MAG: hypothetical protein ABF876_05310 [Acetobacter aceti]